MIEVGRIGWLTYSADWEESAVILPGQPPGATCPDAA